MRQKTNDLPPPRAPNTGLRTASDIVATTQPPRPAKRSKAIREPRKLNGFFRFINGLLTFVFLVLLLAGGLAFVVKTRFDAPGPLKASAVAVIPKGEGIIEIAERLEREGIVSDRRLFVAQYYAARVLGGSGDKTVIKAGEYEIKKEASLKQVLDVLSEGKAILQKITIPEGLTSQQIVERLKSDPNLTGEVTQIPAEGSLLPDTHRFSRGMSRQELIDRMVADQQRVMVQLWEKRQRDLPYQTREQALIMASVIEKETGRADERDKVAAVFVNRLRKNMRLQSDPTIVYGLVGGQGPLGRPISRADIDSKTPYNTYQIDGLPPGPICNPGKSAIEAALNPAKTNDLYFVADTNGGHTFTTNLKDHNSAVQNLRRWEKDQKDQRVRSLQPSTAVQAEPAAVPTASEQQSSTPQKASSAEVPPLPAKKTKKAP